MAAPSLFDYFRRTVVLVLEHTREGALGVVLNRESDSLVSVVVPHLAEIAGGDQLVCLGGPVAPDSVVVLGDFASPSEAGLHVAGSLGTLDPDAENESVRRVRVYAGHAGWSAGQLDGELEAEAWIVCELEEADPFADGDLWATALRRKGGRYRLLATMPDDPSAN